MKGTAKKLLDQQQKVQYEPYEIFIQATRQMMIPLSLIILAFILIYYDENLIGYKVTSPKPEHHIRQHFLSISLPNGQFKKDECPAIKIKENYLSCDVKTDICCGI